MDPYCDTTACAAVFIADDFKPQPIQSPGTSSSLSSRDNSPSRDFSPAVGSLKPPIVIQRGNRGFGFTLRAIKVFFGETEYYTLHHLVVVRNDEMSGYPRKHIHYGHML